MIRVEFVGVYLASVFARTLRCKRRISGICKLRQSGFQENQHCLVLPGTGLVLALEAGRQVSAWLSLPHHFTSFSVSGWRAVASASSQSSSHWPRYRN